MTFDEMCKLEPRLKALHDEVEARDKATPRPDDDAEAWSFNIKPRLESLVGYDSKHPAISTSAAYETAVVAITRTLF